MYTRSDGTVRANQEGKLDKSIVHLSRYRAPWPRQITVDQTRKRARNEIMVDFYKEYRTKLVKWAKTLCRTWSVPNYIYEDCVQNALLLVYKSTNGWDPHKANLWTYTYLGMRKAMMSIVREYHHNKRYTDTPIVRFIESAEDIIARENVDPTDSERTIDEIAFCNAREPLCLYSRIGIRRIVKRRIQQHPKQMQRLLDTLMSDHTYAELARRSPKRISKQGYCHSVQHARRLLKQDLEVTYG